MSDLTKPLNQPVVDELPTEMKFLQLDPMGSSIIDHYVLTIKTGDKVNLDGLFVKIPADMTKQVIQKKLIEFFHEDASFKVLEEGAGAGDQSLVIKVHLFIDEVQARLAFCFI